MEQIKEAAMKCYPIVLVLFFVVVGCELDYQNPVDPESDNYQGYTTQSGLDNAQAVGDGNIQTYFYPELVCVSIVDAQEYQFQICPWGDGFVNLTMDQYWGNAYQLDGQLNLQPGGYHWRVRAWSENREMAGQWSPVYELELWAISEQLYPAGEGVFFPPTDHQEFRWQDIPEASYYEIRVGRTTEELNGMVGQQVVDGATYLYQNLNTQYGEILYWQVRPIDERDQPGFWNGPVQFNVEEAPYDWNNAGIFPPNSAGPTAMVINELRWDSYPNGSFYDVSYDGQTYNIQESFMGLSFPDIPLNREIYWSVKVYDSENREIGTSPQFVFYRRAPDLGEQLYGGYVVYVDHGSEMALVASTGGYAGTYIWGDNIGVGTSQGFFTGAANTSLIIQANQGFNNYMYGAYQARQWVDAQDEYSDWYLPSVDELRAVNDSHINGFIDMHNQLGIYNATYYWTSEEVDVQFALVYMIDSGAAVGNGVEKNRSYNIFPMREQAF